MFTTLLTNLIGLLFGGACSICLIIFLSKMTQRFPLHEGELCEVQVRHTESDTE